MNSIPPLSIASAYPAIAVSHCCRIVGYASAMAVSASIAVSTSSTNTRDCQTMTSSWSSGFTRSIASWHSIRPDSGTVRLVSLQAYSNGFSASRRSSSLSFVLPTDVFRYMLPSCGSSKTNTRRDVRWSSSTAATGLSGVHTRPETVMRKSIYFTSPKSVLMYR